MSMIRVANAPCSWGSLEFEGMEGGGVPYGRMLDELKETGYEGT
jgi:inosose dehydratase